MARVKQFKPLMVKPGESLGQGRAADDFVPSVSNNLPRKLLFLAEALKENRKEREQANQTPDEMITRIFKERK